MSRQHCITVYQFDELNDEAKERARDWMRRMQAEDFYTEFIYEDFIECGKRLGITIATHGVKLMNGTTRQDPNIWWMLHNQGSGASFDGDYEYVKGSPKLIRKHAPEDKTLHQIADDLAEVQKRRFYRLTASIKSDSRDVYATAATIEVFDKVTGNYADENVKEAEDAEAIREALRDFMNWMYKQIDTEYDYRQSDEVIDEDIRANEYEFTESGKRA